MDAKKQELIEQVKAAVLKEARGMRELNAVVPVTGTRYDLPVNGREINIVYFQAKQEHAPLIIGFHGGGYLFGGSALNDDMWSAVRDELEMNVASVDYRQSPDYQWREALDDAYDASVYLKEHAVDFGFDPEQIYVMGASAGAGLAATACIYAKQLETPIYKGQILLYPFADAATDPDSKGEGSLTGPVMYVFNELHCSPKEAQNPLVSPVFVTTEEAAGLPPAIIVYADIDCLKHEGMRFAETLLAAGVPVADRLEEGMPHGYFENGFSDPEKMELSFLSEMEVNLIKDGSCHRSSEKTMAFIKENLCI